MNKIKTVVRIDGRKDADELFYATDDLMVM